MDKLGAHKRTEMQICQIKQRLPIDSLLLTMGMDTNIEVTAVPWFNESLQTGVSYRTNKASATAWIQLLSLHISIYILYNKAPNIRT